MTKARALTLVVALAVLVLGVVVLRSFGADASPATAVATDAAARDPEAPLHHHDDHARPEASTVLGAAGLRGRVIDDRGDHVEGAVVRLELDGRERSVQNADAAGRFVITELTPGRYTLSVVSARHRRHEREVRLVSAEEREVEVVLTTGRVLAGKVVDSAGRPVAGTNVGTSDLSGFAVQSAEDGSFELMGLGDDPVNLFAQKSGYAPRHEHGVRPGGRGLVLTLEVESAVRGRVEGMPDAGAVTVSLCRLDAHFGRELCVARALVYPAEPTFELKGVAAGRYDLVGEIGEQEVARVPIVLPPADVLVLQRPVSVDVRR